MVRSPPRSKLTNTRLPNEPGFRSFIISALECRWSVFRPSCPANMLLHARQKTGRHFRTGPVCSQEEHHVESGPPSEPLSRNLVVGSTFSMFAEIKTLALDLWAEIGRASCRERVCQYV